MELKDLQVVQALLEIMDPKALQEQQVHKVQMVLLVIPVHKVQVEVKVHKVLKVQLALQVILVQ